jgi:hypothetical protein
MKAIIFRVLYKITLTYAYDLGVDLHLSALGFMHLGKGLGAVWVGSHRIQGYSDTEFHGRPYVHICRRTSRV